MFFSCINREVKFSIKMQLSARFMMLKQIIMSLRLGFRKKRRHRLTRKSGVGEKITQDPKGKQNFP